MRQARAAIQCALRALAAGALAASAGCASPPPHPVAGAFLGNQGGAWEALLAPEGSPLADAGAETWRRDAALSATQPGSILETNLWPEPYRPSLDQTRRAFISTCPSTVTYFGRSPAYRPVYSPARIYLWP